MSLLYLVSLLIPAFCMGLVDRRWRLFLFAGRPRTAWTVLLTGAAFFLVWDLVAIGQGMYERGDSTAMTGIEVAHELPLEEIVFVLFLCYVTMVVHGLARLLLARRSSTSAPERRARTEVRR
ncbi:lycopene cyclase domain-containing protein [Nocardioides sp. CER19]|uniref:lycopene cyclase domain-containing protein n=1 Tax=Nocardioides sp. CER19 TaxID=3038538 RepID=UPI002446C874|nr:lycopene cyclase domain-containing protein [Nocardioides sp. CER19]MDH2416244.1 lycopene cyclase domain-containing protein [Nocardioides sp. CER19]